MKFSVLLKAASGILFGPVVPIFASIVEYMGGEKSGVSTLASLGLAGLIDLDIDFDIERFEPDLHLSQEVYTSSLAVASSILGSGLNDYVSRNNCGKKDYDPYTPRSIALNRFKYLNTHYCGKIGCPGHASILHKCTTFDPLEAFKPNNLSNTLINHYKLY